MIIARHNYEEYFLMYVDNELTAAERAAVELFAQQNPDLAAELDILMQTKLTADDTLLFGNKKDLLQNIDTVNIHNYEEQFLLYIDKELDKPGKESVEKFVLQHPQFQDEFTLLKHTVLEPETVIFEDKESLLKEEERRVIPMFIRFAAAAAIIGIAVLVWWMQDNKTTSTPQIAVQQNIDSVTDNIAVVPEEKTEQVLHETIVSEKRDENKNKITASITAQTAEQKKNNALVKDQQTNIVKQAVIVTPPLVTKDENNIAAAHKPDATNNNNDITKDILASLDNNTSTNITKEKTDQEYIDEALRYAKNTDASNSKYAKNALYKELSTDEEEHNSLYLGSMQINKNKVRGFMKKVGGLFAGKSKDGNANGDGKLQVANLELNTN